MTEDQNSVGVRYRLHVWEVEKDSRESNAMERLPRERILCLLMRSQHRYGDIKVR